MEWPKRHGRRIVGFRLTWAIDCTQWQGRPVFQGGTAFAFHWLFWRFWFDWEVE